MTFDPDFGTPYEIADFYRHKGFNVVPATGKRPAVNWRDYQNAMVAPEIFEGWYNQRDGRHKANGNVGVLLGKGSGGMYMVDLDTYKPGGEKAQAWWDGLLAVHNNRQELETWEQITGGGGRQMFFECPPGWTPPNVTTNIFIDIKGDGGFAMLPPSRHASGKLYKWREGRSPDDIPLLVAPQWLCDEIDRLDPSHGGGRAKGGNGKHEAPGGAYNEWGRQYDGREDRLTRFVWGVACDWRRACPIKPTLTEQQAKCTEKYAIWESLVTPQTIDASKTKTQLLEDEGRGPTAFWAKFQRCMDQWDGKLLEEANKPPPKQDEPDLEADFSQHAKQSEEKAKTTGNTLELLDVRQIKAMTDPEWMVEGIVIEQSLGFIYGPPGSLKTFIALDLALSFAGGLVEWWGRKIARRGAVIYVSSEGHANLKFRIMAWEQNRKTVADDAPFYLIRQSLNFMKGDDVGLLLATVEAAAALAKCPIAAVFVDTVSRVLPGAEENQQKDMTIFVKACDQVRERFKCVVFGVHHTNKEGGFRGSTVMPAAGDFMVEVRREAGAMVGSIHARKVKDAEDGWEQQFKVEKIALGLMGTKSSLVVNADDGTAAKAGAQDDGWPNKDVLRKILSALAEEWFNRRPWTHSKNSARYAVTNISKRWRLKREVVKDILEEWMANGVVAHEVCDARNHISGYRKLTDI